VTAETEAPGRTHPWRWRADGSALAAGVLACLLLSGWFSLDREQPLSFVGDHLLTLGTAKALVDGQGFRWNEHLGLPGVRDAMQHPTFYFVQKSILRVAAWATGSAAAAVAWLYAIGLGLVFGAGYWSLRRLGIGAAWAWFGAVVFVLTPYVAVRAAFHDMLALCFSVPIGAALALTPALSRSGDPMRPGPSVRELGALAVIVGASGMYYGFFTGFFAVVVALVIALRDRSVRPLIVATASASVVVVTMLVTGPGIGLADIARGDVPVPRRLAHEQAMYGLVIGDAVRVLGTLPGAPDSWGRPIDGVSGEGTFGEWPGLLLTVVILLAPFALAAHALSRRPISGDRRLLTLLCAVCVTIGLLFAVRGGVGLLFNSLVTPAIRAQNRVMPFLTFFALVAVLQWVDTRGAVTIAGRRLVPVLVTLGLLAGMWPALGFLRTAQARFAADRTAQDTRASIEAMLSRAHGSGVTRVLQLPVVHWPEAEAIGAWTPYHLELPYIIDRPNSPIRWSYGLSNRQPMYGYLSTVVHTHTDADLPAAAAALGFDAILIERAAFEPARLDVMVATVEAALGSACRVFADDRRALYSLSRVTDASCAPAKADLSTIRYETTSVGRGGPILVGGWAQPEAGFTWTDGRVARLLVPLSPDMRSAPAVEVRLAFFVYRPDPGRAKVIEFVAGDLSRRVALVAGETPPGYLALRIPQEQVRPDGTVEIIVRTPDAERPSDSGGSDRRQLGIALSEVVVRAELADTPPRP
jgi:hypothetical protein